MSKVWRRLQRVGKKATKFRFSSYSHSLQLTCDSKWQPDKLCIIWSRRGRQNSSQLAQWEPGLKNVYEGSCVWDKSSGVIEFDVTLYKSLNDNKYEDKEWNLLIENEDSKGKRRLLASAKVNLNDYAQSLEPINQVDIKDLVLKCESSKIKSSSISFSIACQFIKDGKATDEDMMSIASYMSVSSLNKNPYLDSNAIKSKQLAKDTTKFKNLTKKFNVGLDSRLDNGDDDDAFDYKSDNSNSNNGDEEDDPDYYLKLQAKNELMNQNMDSISQNFQGGTIDFQSSFIKSIDKFDQPIAAARASQPHVKPIIKQAGGGRLEKLVNESFNSANLDATASPSSFSNKSSSSVRSPASFSTANLNTSSTLVSSKASSSANSTALVSPPSVSLNSSADSRKKPLAPKQVVKESNPFIEVSSQEAANLSNPFLEVSKSTETNDEPKKSSSNKKKTVAPLPPVPSKKPLTTTFSAHNIDSQPATNTSNDLLDWCREKIDSFKDFPPDSLQYQLFHGLTIGDFSSSWRDGLAFCALIYHFRPNLINLNELSAVNPTKNLRQTFSACDAENIGRCIDYIDIVNCQTLDKLILMTFLYQLRDHFDSKSISTATFSSNYNLNHRPADQTVQSLDSLAKSSSSPAKARPKLIKPTSLAASTPIKAVLPNQHDISTNPFEEAEPAPAKPKVDKNNNNNSNSKEQSSGLIQILPDGQITDAMSEQAQAPPDEKPASSNRKKRQLPQQPASASEPPAAMDSEQLYEKAKQLIERNKLQQQKSISREEEIKKLTRQHSKASKPEAPKFNPGQLDAMAGVKPAAIETPTANIMKLLNGEDMGGENLGNEYINQEIINLKKEQDELDDRGDYLEKQLRRIMNSHDARSPSSSSEEKQKIKMAEDNLLREWFLLVNKRNALLHRQQELELLQNEKNLERRSELLTEQLRKLMAIDDFHKTVEQKSLEKILFNELINLVNKRNELVVLLDEENKLMNEEEQINEFIQNKPDMVEPEQKQPGCSIQ